MVESTSVYDSRGIRRRLKGFTESLFKSLQIERNEPEDNPETPDLQGPDGVYRGFRISIIGTREKGRGLEIRVDVGCSGEPRDANTDAERLLKYTKFFDSWDIFSSDPERNGSDIRLPAANRSDIEKLKECIQFIESEKDHNGLPLVRIYYSFGRPFIEKNIKDKENIARLAYRVLIAHPLIYWMDKNYPDRPR